MAGGRLTDTLVFDQRSERLEVYADCLQKPKQAALHYRAQMGHLFLMADAYKALHEAKAHECGSWSCDLPAFFGGGEPRDFPGDGQREMVEQAR